MNVEKLSQPIEYLKGGAMKYNPEFHHNHGIPFTESELEYLCKFYESDGLKLMSLALGKTEKVITSKVSYLRKKKISKDSNISMYEYYKNLNKHW